MIIIWSILKNVIVFECQKVCKQVRDERSMEANKNLKCYYRMKIKFNPKALASSDCICSLFYSLKLRNILISSTVVSEVFSCPLSGLHADSVTVILRKWHIAIVM